MFSLPAALWCMWSTFAAPHTWVKPGVSPSHEGVRQHWGPSGPEPVTPSPAGFEGHIRGLCLCPWVTPRGRCADPWVPVPRSLLERKELWRRQTEERLRSLPDPDTPPGHTLMPESQRLDTLCSLKQSKRERNRDSSSDKHAVLDRIRQRRHRDAHSCCLESCLD